MDQKAGNCYQQDVPKDEQAQLTVVEIFLYQYEIVDIEDDKERYQSWNKTDVISAAMERLPRSRGKEWHSEKNRPYRNVKQPLVTSCVSFLSHVTNIILLLEKFQPCSREMML